MLKFLSQLTTIKKVLAACTVIFLVLYIVYLPSVVVIKTDHEEHHTDHLKTLLNLSEIASQNFAFIEPIPRCPNSTIRVFIVVCSAAENFLARRAIRSSWGKPENYNGSVQVYFLIGRPMDRANDEFIEVEQKEFSDVIRYNFTDTYTNLTLKSFMLLQWIQSICHQADFIMKSDDDTFVNVPYLLQELSTLKNENLLLGHLIEKAPPIRDESSKWYASKSSFSGTYYPNYLSGSGYLMSTDIVPLIYKSALRQTFFYLEDIFITGICAQASGLKPQHHSSFSYKKPRLEVCVLKHLITAHRLRPNEHIMAWKAIRSTKVNCRVRRRSSGLFHMFFSDSFL